MLDTSDANIIDDLVRRPYVCPSAPILDRDGQRGVRRNSHAVDRRNLRVLVRSIPMEALALVLIIVVALLSTVCAADTRHLTDSPSTTNGGIPVAPVVGVAAAAAVAVVILVTIKEAKDLELHEVVISPSQPAAQAMSTKKQFVYTAQI
ncbi:hypothetical protein GQ600_24532 [Phytophthora cactorum]|nr:hypothetical protein GQ600_24532 [Phytophthora cactorum]